MDEDIVAEKLGRLDLHLWKWLTIKIGLSHNGTSPHNEDERTKRAKLALAGEKERIHELREPLVKAKCIVAGEFDDLVLVRNLELLARIRGGK